MPPEVEPLPVPNRENLRFKQQADFGLRLETFSGASADIIIRGYTKDGLFSFKERLNSTGAKQTFNFRIHDIPIALSVLHELTTFEQAEVYATISLTIGGDKLQELAAGVVNEQRGISYPVTNSVDPIPGMGLLRTISGSNPSAGSGASIQQQANAVWRLRSFKVTLVTDANAGDRNLHLSIENATDNIQEFYGAIVQPASTTRIYFFLPLGAVPPALNGNEIIVNMPADLLIGSESVIQTLLENAKAGDDFGAPIASVEQWWSPGE